MQTRNGKTYLDAAAIQHRKKSNTQQQQQQQLWGIYNGARDKMLLRLLMKMASRTEKLKQTHTHKWTHTHTHTRTLIHIGIKYAASATWLPRLLLTLAPKCGTMGKAPRKDKLQKK